MDNITNEISRKNRKLNTKPQSSKDLLSDFLATTWALTTKVPAEIFFPVVNEDNAVIYPLASNRLKEVMRLFSVNTRQELLALLLSLTGQTPTSVRENGFTIPSPAKKLLGGNDNTASFVCDIIGIGTPVERFAWYDNSDVDYSKIYYNNAPLNDCFGGINTFLSLFTGKAVIKDGLVFGERVGFDEATPITEKPFYNLSLIDNAHTNKIVACCPILGGNLGNLLRHVNNKTIFFADPEFLFNQPLVGIVNNGTSTRLGFFQYGSTGLLPRCKAYDASSHLKSIFYPRDIDVSEIGHFIALPPSMCHSYTGNKKTVKRTDKSHLFYRSLFKEDNTITFAFAEGECDALAVTMIYNMPCASYGFTQAKSKRNIPFVNHTLYSKIKQTNSNVVVFLDTSDNMSSIISSFIRQFGTDVTFYFFDKKPTGELAGKNYDINDYINDAMEFLLARGVDSKFEILAALKELISGNAHNYHKLQETHPELYEQIEIVETSPELVVTNNRHMLDTINDIRAEESPFLQRVLEHVVSDASPQGTSVYGTMGEMIGLASSSVFIEAHDTKNENAKSYAAYSNYITANVTGETYLQWMKNPTLPSICTETPLLLCLETIYVQPSILASAQKTAVAMCGEYPSCSMNCAVKAHRDHYKIRSQFEFRIPQLRIHNKESLESVRKQINADCKKTNLNVSETKREAAYEIPAATKFQFVEPSEAFTAQVNEQHYEAVKAGLKSALNALVINDNDIFIRFSSHIHADIILEAQSLPCKLYGTLETPEPFSTADSRTVMHRHVFYVTRIELSDYSVKPEKVAEFARDKRNILPLMATAAVSNLQKGVQLQPLPATVDTCMDALHIAMGSIMGSYGHKYNPVLLSLYVLMQHSRGQIEERRAALNLIIAGPTSCGKTTALKETSRLYSMTGLRGAIGQITNDNFHSIVNIGGDATSTSPPGLRLSVTEYGVGKGPAQYKDNDAYAIDEFFSVEVMKQTALVQELMSIMAESMTTATNARTNATNEQTLRVYSPISLIGNIDYLSGTACNTERMNVAATTYSIYSANSPLEESQRGAYQRRAFGLFVPRYSSAIYKEQVQTFMARLRITLDRSIPSLADEVYNYVKTFNESGADSSAEPGWYKSDNKEATLYLLSLFRRHIQVINKKVNSRSLKCKKYLSDKTTELAWRVVFDPLFADVSTTLKSVNALVLGLATGFATLRYDSDVKECDIDAALIIADDIFKTTLSPFNSCNSIEEVLNLASTIFPPEFITRLMSDMVLAQEKQIPDVTEDEISVVLEDFRKKISSYRFVKRQAVKMDNVNEYVLAALKGAVYRITLGRLIMDDYDMPKSMENKK